MAIVGPPVRPGGKRPLGSELLLASRLDSTIMRRYFSTSSDVLLLSASAYESNTHEQ